MITENYVKNLATIHQLIYYGIFVNYNDIKC